jgi:hypothetical protein
MFDNMPAHDVSYRGTVSVREDPHVQSSQTQVGVADGDPRPRRHSGVAHRRWVVTDRARGRYDTNWIVWLAFCAEFVWLLHLAPNKRRFVRESWFDLLIIVVSPPFALVPEAWQGLRAARALRLLRLLRAFAFLSIGLKTTRRLLEHRRFNYVLLATSGVMLLGAVGIYIIERNVNEDITSPGDALWWRSAQRRLSAMATSIR